MNRYNPLPYMRPRTAGSIRKAQRSYREGTVGAGRALQKSIWKWMRSYGLSVHGFTFMDQNTYIKQRMGEERPHPYTMEAIYEMSLNAPLFILTSGTERDDMHSLLTYEPGSVFFNKMREKHFKYDPDYMEKLNVVVGKLASELDQVVRRAGWEVGEEAPEMLEVTLKSGYPHRNYHVFPVWLRNTIRGSMKTMLPWY